MVRENIKKHDQLSFEAKFEFMGRAKALKSNNFNVSIFMFLPYGLDINKHNFTREDFYTSLKTSIRLTTPFYRLSQLIDGENSPFVQLQKSIESILATPNSTTSLEYEKQIKRYCSIFRVALRYDVNIILRSDDIEEKGILIEKYKRNVINIRTHFIDIKQRIINSSSDNSILRIYQYADEYQSLVAEKHSANIIKSLSKQKVNYSVLIKSVEEIITGEMDYRLKMAYPSIAIKNQPYFHLLHRMARLKKFVESNLYLNTDTKKEGVVVEQLLFSIAAGIAMIFATGVAFASQLIYGNLSLPFFIALVIGYMFKDRIKELIRIFFSKKHQKVFYDFKTKIYSQNKKKIGSLKESFNFVRHSHLPMEILNTRNNIRATEITEESLGEKIIQYRTKVKIYNKVKGANDFSGITQILRFNLSSFTQKMDDPEKEILIRTKNSFKRVFSDRVYHVNIILTYTDNNKQIIKPYKIYTNRKVIRRIEKIKNYPIISSA